MKVPRERLEKLFAHAGLGTSGHDDAWLVTATLALIKGGEFSNLEDSDDADLVDEILADGSLEVGVPDRPQLGVVETIVEVMKGTSRSAPVTHEAVLWELVQRFPDRDPHRMMNTVRKWLPSRLRLEKHLNVKAVNVTGTKNGGFYVEE